MKKILILLFGIGLFTLSFCNANAQLSEKAMCKITANNKEYNLKPNAGGYFQRIANIQKLATVPIEISYPDGNAGDKIVLSVLDGGTLDNAKMVKVVQLD